MTDDPKTALDRCETLMLDMDGTILDLAYDNYMWLQHVPQAYAVQNGLTAAQAKQHLYAKFSEMRGQLEWYCLDHWSEFLDLDVAGMHREQNHRIGYLPGAEQFLEVVRSRDIRVLLVTNSHQQTLDIKDDVTGVTAHFDAVYTSHAFGHAKEDQGYWQKLAAAESFDPAKTLFIDDTARVLDSAAKYGISMLAEITRPDSTEPARSGSDYAGLDALADLL